MKENNQFTLKNGRKINIVEPSMKYLRPITEFINRLAREDTYLSFTEEVTLAMEKNWLKNTLNEIKHKKTYIIWAEFNGKIIGGCDVRHGGNRDWHVGTIGLMVDQDFRRMGLGKFLLTSILEKAKELKIQIVTLLFFDDNIAAIKLYQKLGFKEWGRLPNGLYRKNKYSDKIEMYKTLN